nr:hypothetical protein [Tanacetum cinerariifolium]
MIAKLKAKDVGNKSCGTTTPTNPKVLAPGMYAIGPKYIIPHRRTNRETPIPMSRKKHVTFKEPPKPSPRVTKKPVAPQVKKANVALKDTITALRIQNDGFKVTNATQKTKIAKLKAKDVGNKSSGTTTPTNPKVLAPGMYAIGIKYATRASKTTSTNHAWIYRKLLAKISISNLNAIFDACHECLFSFNHDKCVVYSMNSVKPKATPNRQTTKKFWKQKVVAHAKPQWMPTGWHFTLYDSYPLTWILDPMEEPLELSLSVSFSSNVTMLSSAASIGGTTRVPLSPDYVPCPEYPEYLVPADDKIFVEDQPYADYASPIALSLGYVADSDPEEDSDDGLVDYPADGGDDDDDDDSSDDDDEEEASEEEEHLASADSVVAPIVDPVSSSEETEPFETDESVVTPPPPPVNHTTPLGARISIRPQAPMPFPSEAEVERLFTLPTPPPLISLSPPSTEERLARCLAAPALPSSPHPIVPHPYGSPNHVRVPRGFKAAIGRLRASSPSTYHPLHPSPPLPSLPSSLYLPPYVPTSLPLPSPPLPASLFIPSPVERKEDIPEAELPPRKRPTGGHRADYGFIDTLDAKARRQRAEEVGYSIRDVWVDPAEAVEEDRQTRLSQRVDVLIEDREFHHEIVLLMEHEALVSLEDWAQSVGLSSTVHQELQAYRTHTQIQDYWIASQDSLTATLVTQISFLQGQLLAALGQIQAL